jgi:uncharacterized Fe-S radical SAM superfamily protein PflX
MGQYRPRYQVGSIAKSGQRKYTNIERNPARAEMDGAFRAAQQAGLWRFDERRPHLGLFAR